MRRVTFLLLIALACVALSAISRSESVIAADSKTIEDQLLECQQSKQKIVAEAASEKKKLTESCGTRAAEDGELAKRELKSLQEKIENCDKRSQAAESDASIARKQLQEEASAAKLMREKDVADLLALLSPLKHLEEQACGKDASLCSLSPGQRFQQAVQWALQKPSLESEVQRLSASLADLRSSASSTAACEDRLRSSKEQAEATVSELRAQLRQKALHLEEVHRGWLPPWLADRLSSLQEWANATLPRVVEQQKKVLSAALGLLSASHPAVQQAVQSLNASLSAAHTRVQPALLQAQAALQDLQPRLLLASSSAVCSLQPYLLRGVNLTESAAIQAATLSSSALSHALPRLQWAEQAAREQLALAQAQAWQRLGPELQERLSRAGQAAEDVAAPAWQAASSSLQPAISALHAAALPHARVLLASLNGSLASLGSASQALPQQLREALALCRPAQGAEGAAGEQPVVLPVGPLLVLTFGMALATLAAAALVLAVFSAALGPSHPPKKARRGSKGSRGAAARGRSKPKAPAPSAPVQRKA